MRRLDRVPPPPQDSCRLACDQAYNQNVQGLQAVRASCYSAAYYQWNECQYLLADYALYCFSFLYSTQMYDTCMWYYYGYAAQCNNNFTSYVNYCDGSYISGEAWLADYRDNVCKASCDPEDEALRMAYFSRPDRCAVVPSAEMLLAGGRDR